jgi:hypothetical protein
MENKYLVVFVPFCVALGRGRKAVRYSDLFKYCEAIVQTVYISQLRNIVQKVNLPDVLRYTFPLLFQIP